MISLLYYFAVGTLSLVGAVFVALCLTSGVGWIVLKALRREYYDFEDILNFGIVTVLLLIFVILMVALGAALTGNA